jgi:hypothetical protein
LDDISFLLNVLGAVGGLGGLAAIVGVAYWLGRKFTEIDYRFAMVDQRFEAVDKRFGAIDEKLRQVDEGFEQLETELKDYIDAKFEESRKYADERLSGLEGRLASRIERLATAYASYQEFFVEFLTAERVVKPEYRDMLVKHAANMMKLAALNPLTREEWGKLREYFERSQRDELTLEEADEFLELARRVVKEYGERPEAWKLHIYAAMTRALTAKRYYEQRAKQEARQ